LLAVCLLLVSAPAQEKKLAVYAARASYTISVSDRDNKEYVGLIDLLEPLGNVSAKADGKKWKLRFAPPGSKGEIEAQFSDGKTPAKVRGHGVELASRFVLENGRGLVPLHSLSAVMTMLLATPVDLHEPGRRLFVGNVGVHYNAELRKLPARLVLSFSAPVNPFVATEPGRLRMVFTREPVLAPAGSMQTLDDRTISGLTFSEANGQAELAVSGSVPLLASFSDGGKTITITAAPQPVAPAPPIPMPAPAPAGPLPPAPPTAAAQPKFLVVIDPGHGGSEGGAALGDFMEKDFNLALARRLRAELEGRGLRAILLRDSDTDLTLEQRALMANGAHAAVYVGVHAALSGAGVRVYTASLELPPQKPGAFLPWEVAQAAYLDASSALARAIADELAKRQVPAAEMAAPLRPLNNVAAAAVAIEVAPPPNDVQGLASPVYQQSICSAIAGALTSVRARLEASR
jgi:N-acetylmuramoyl-L-alanine amidase